MAPLIAAAGYVGLPRLLGYLSDQAIQARMEALVPKLQALGMSPQEIQDGLASDPYLNALALTPRRSGVESAFAALRDIYNGNPYGMSREDIPPPGADVSGPDARTIDQMLSGQGFDMGAPAQAYVMRDGQFLTPMDDFLRYGGRDDDEGRYFRSSSYGQTDQPATEVRFDQPSGGANGGLAALIRRGYA